ncbi:MAG TPA: histone deacetylase [Gemmatimonadales bacterium]|nr:histone deacetylase [Gemmatimonadales bacterium]
MTHGAAGQARVFWHPSHREHDAGLGHPESAGRVSAILQHLMASPLAERVSIEESTEVDDALLGRVHDAEYLRLLTAVSERGGGRLDADTVMVAGSLRAARYAAGAAVAAMRSALAGVPAFAAIRPPGHHATAREAMGFCLLNNVVIAARAALDEFALERVLIVDWDVHHGNGTQDLVEREPRIRFVSLHQWPLYPGTGRATERGVGNIFNVPRPPGLPRATYVADLNEAVVRATDGWSPQLILISAGFDAMAGDPLAGFTLEPEDYATWIRSWRRHGAPIASVLEGGYVPHRIRLAAEAHLAALL